jgi:sugar fermentation stimulation protein A
MLHTHHNNLVARKLIEDGLAHGLEGAEIFKAEHQVGRSRFDFLIRDDNADVLLEVKSCTLYRDTLAMFPDAVSSRATKHLLELEELTRKGYRTHVLFVVHSPTAQWFMPEHHTDLAFCRALLEVRERVQVNAVAVSWAQDLTLKDGARELSIPWDLVERESHDRGSYLVVLRLPRDRKIEVGSLGDVQFQKGYYLYAGSAMKDLGTRLARHQRLTKKKHWHIVHLREHTEFMAGIPIRSSTRLECEIASALSKIAAWQVPGFGSSDCDCPSHLFAMRDDPFGSRAFSDLLLYFRMGKLEEELRSRSAGMGVRSRQG